MINLELQQKDLGNAEHEIAKRRIGEMGFSGVETRDDAEKLIDSIQKLGSMAAQYRYDNPGRKHQR